MTEHKPGSERREEIIDAMIVTMAEHGYARATIAKVADAAGLTPGLLHYHFRSKKEILRGSLTRLSTQWRAMLAELVTEAAGPAGALDAVLEAMLAPGRDAQPERVSAWVAILAEAIREPEVASDLTAALLELRSLLEELLAEGVSAGDFDLGESSPEAFAAGLIALFQGYFTIGVTARAVVPRGSALAVARSMVAGVRT